MATTTTVQVLREALIGLHVAAVAEGRRKELDNLLQDLSAVGSDFVENMVRPIILRRIASLSKQEGMG